MIKLEQLPKLVKKSARRRGRGYGSGRGGHTVGRGSKGQKARSKVGALFEGTKRKKSLLKRLPVWRGKRKRSFYRKVTISLDWLERQADPKKVVDRQFLRQLGVIGRPLYRYRPKVVKKGKLTKSLKVAIPVSKAAAAAIKKAGGSVIPPATPPGNGKH